MNLKLNSNPLVQFLQKPAKDFTKADIMKYIEHNHIEMVNFRYVGSDGRLKALNFTVNDYDYIDTILSSGERVDGSSLFSHIEAGSSDLYVVPRFCTAFVNPFSDIPAIDILCAYFDKDGKPLENAPEYLLQKAHKSLKEVTGLDFEVMGELEYYVISEEEDIFRATDQKGYHESEPFCKWGDFRTEAMYAIARAGGLIKYGHSEVGTFTMDGKLYEQNEIEFLPTRLEDAADQLVIAKWIMRTLAYKYNMTITFAPKITLGKAGSGMHVHTRLMKDGKNMMVDKGQLTDVAKKAMAGYLYLAPSLTAFGNTNPTSYFRLVPHQEAPTNICWGDRNRSALVRVPLGWTGNTDMSYIANPLEKEQKCDFTEKQTVEFRCSDGSADIHQLLAGLAVAARYGFEMENALQYAEERYVGVNIFHEEHKAIAAKLSHLPTSCIESADALEQQRKIYEKFGIFNKGMIDGIIKKLRSFNDANLRKEVAENQDKMWDMIKKYFHCG
ncbi:MAG: glutamine synthetase family protein [Prevotellaceae bacterium]|jgi:glutamine synthetase|nr:glutamine synthetase family protein [Prevotellaceae bacterium]